VLDEDVVVAAVAHHTGDGFETEMVAVPDCSPSKLACMVPPES
jgi:hypothetical protein